MAMSEADRTYIQQEFKDTRDEIGGVHKRLDPVCEQVARNTTHISWLRWAVGIVVSSLILVGVGAALAGVVP